MPAEVDTEMPDEHPAELLVRVLGVDRSIAERLIAHELTTLEEIAYVPEAELREVEGLSPALIPLIRERAKQYLFRKF